MKWRLFPKLIMMCSVNKTHIIFVSILTFLLLSYKLTWPFWGHHEFNGVYYGMIAKNYLRYGLWATKGGQVNNLYPALPSEWSYHVNHPATYPLLLALSFRMFGVTEVTARLVSIIASVLGVVFLAKLLSALYKDHVAWLAAVVVIFSPLFLYFGSLPVFEPILFPVVTLGLWRYFITRRIKFPGSVIIVSFAASLIDWPGFWLPVSLIVYEWLTRKRKKLILFLVATTLLAFFIIIAHQAIVTGSALENLKGVFEYRFSVTKQPYTPIAWVRLLAARTRAFWGLPIIVASGIGYLLAFRGTRKLGGFLSAILALGLAHILVFRNITWYHDYMLYHTIPFVGASLGSLLSFVFRKTRSRIAVYMLVAILIGLTITTTNAFFIALASMNGYKDCTEMAYAARTNPTPLTFRLSQEKAKECPPFVGFYAEKPFGIKAY